MTPHAQRRTRLRKSLTLGPREVLLVTNIVNVGYLTGFTGSAGWLLVMRDSDLLLSDSRYATQLVDECPGLECDIRDSTSTTLEQLSRVAKSAKYSAMHYESDSLTKSAFDKTEAELTGVELISTSSLVEDLRAIKDKTEIETIRQAIRINERAFNVIRAQLHPGQTELEMAHNLEHQMRQFGATGFAFEPIIAVGARAALPHGRPSLQTIDANPLLLFDWGARFNRYNSDLTRVLVTGKIPAKLRKIYDIVLTAQMAAIDAIRPGATFKAVDAAARKVIESAGFGKQFGHGTGHGLGLEVHETPSLSPIRDGSLESGMMVTVEPGIYLPGWGGVRIEDNILVTPDGHEVVSSLPKQLDQCVVEF